MSLSNSSLQQLQQLWDERIKDAEVVAFYDLGHEVIESHYFKESDGRILSWCWDKWVDSEYSEYDKLFAEHYEGFTTATLDNIRAVISLRLSKTIDKSVCVSDLTKNDRQMPVLPHQVWKHSSGVCYQVLMVTNEEATKVDYLPTVVYQNVSDKTLWSRPLSSWHYSFELVATDLSDEKQAVIERVKQLRSRVDHLDDTAWSEFQRTADDLHQGANAGFTQVLNIIDELFPELENNDE